MIFKWVRAKCFLSIGESGILVAFDKMSNIIVIKGQNLDVSPQSSNGAGKCWGKNTPILMFDGTVKMVQDVGTGDLVMGPDSKPRKVLCTHSGRMMMYDVIPKKGDKYTVNELHTLVLKNSHKYNDEYKYSRFFNEANNNYEISAGDFSKQSKHFKNLMKGYRTGVDFQSKKVFIDPYILGVWLGDGTTSRPHVTTADSEVKDALFSEAKERNLSITVANGDRMAPSYRFCRKDCANSFIEDLRKYDLLNNKHIPHDYKVNDKNVRMEVLAGLMDTDGHASRGGFDFINKNKILAEDVMFLARSLGLAAYIKECKKSCQTGAVGTYYRVYISGNCDEIPVRISRKKCPPRLINKDPLVVGIDVKPVGEGDYYGFQVDGDGLLLLGDFTVVHNSTLIECVIYALFGKLIKDLSHKDAINKKLKKGLEVELCFELDGHEYRILRKRKPDALYLFKDGDDITLGGMPDTQKEIENIVKLNFDAFVNVVCFGEHNNHAFLACDAATKRVIVENLLGLEKYLKYCKTAKESLKAVETKLATQRKSYETYTEQMDALGKRITQLESKQATWVMGKQEEVRQLQTAIAKKEQEIIDSADDGASLVAYQQAQDRIKVNKDELVKSEENRSKIATLLDEIKGRLDKLQEAKGELNIKVKEKESEISIKTAEIKVLEQQMNKLSSLQPGVKCNVCYGVVDQSNYDHMILHNHGQITNLNEQVEVLTAAKNALVEKFKDVVNKQATITQTKSQADAKLLQITTKMKNILEAIQNDSKIKEPQVGAKGLVFAEQLAELKRRLVSKLDELDNHDPYVEILTQARVEAISLDEKIVAIKDIIADGEKWIPYYEFWIEGFGDDGIRAYVIDGILPALNARINYWLQFLIDNKIQLTFDNKFNATIQRNPVDGDPFVYNATSGGERRRINLAISQAFAHVMMISAGISPSLISLDEVALNVDVPGVHGIYAMIQELARERQVLVTTHDPNLNDLLQSCDTLKVVKKDGFTSIAA